MQFAKLSLVLLILLAAVTMVFSGCGQEKGQEPKKAISPPVKTEKEKTVLEADKMQAEPPKDQVKLAEVAAPPEPEMKEAKTTKRSTWFSATSHVVKKDECLWWIAQYREVYNDPWQWPRIYEANRDQIENPDLIYPGQILKIPR